MKCQQIISVREKVTFVGTSKPPFLKMYTANDAPVYALTPV